MAFADFNIRRELVFRAALCMFCCTLLSTGVRAQDTSSTTVQKGPTQYETQVNSGTVIYVSGNDVVIKGDNGVVKHYIVSNNQTFTMNGKQVTVKDLKPGTHLTQKITTATTPTVVTTTRTIQGKVWHVNAPSMVILTLPDGTNKEYKVPKGQMFMINGKEESVFQLKKGMNVSAQVVTEEPVTEVAHNQQVTGVAPPPPPMPDTVGVLLIETPTPATPAPQTASVEPAPKALPKTGSEWPLVGLLGLGSLGAGLLTRRLRLGWK